MLAINRQHLHAVFAGLAHDDFARHHEDLFRGDGNIFAGANGRQRRLQSRGAHDSYQHDVGPGNVASLTKPSAPEKTSAAGRANRATVRLCRVGDGDGLGPVLPRLFQKEIDVVPGRQTEQTEPVRQILDHFDGAGADGAGAA